MRLPAVLRCVRVHWPRIETEGKKNRLGGVCRGVGSWRERRRRRAFEGGEMEAMGSNALIARTALLLL
jgi:hypothetical protein